MASRTWKGSVSFGLVNIPIGVYLATKNAEFSFNQLCANGYKIRYKKWCPTEEREVAYSEIKKGYEIAKDQYVVLEKKDLETIKLKPTNTIDIKEFVDEKELDPIMIYPFEMIYEADHFDLFDNVYRYFQFVLSIH